MMLSQTPPRRYSVEEQKGLAKQSEEVETSRMCLNNFRLCEVDNKDNRGEAMKCFLQAIVGAG